MTRQAYNRIDREWLVMHLWLWLIEQFSHERAKELLPRMVHELVANRTNGNKSYEEVLAELSPLV